MAGGAMETEDRLYELNGDDYYPEVLPWFRDKSANNWNLAGHKWGGIFPQDLDRLKMQNKNKEARASAKKK